MSFRQNNLSSLSVWRKRNVDNLTRIGLPSEIASNHKRFLLTVQNGEDLESEWDASRLSSEDAGKLLDLLQEQFDDLGWDLVKALKRRCGA
jgi:hypothetical protein